MLAARRLALLGTYILKEFITDCPGQVPVTWQIKNGGLERGYLDALDTLCFMMQPSLNP